MATTQVTSGRLPINIGTITGLFVAILSAIASFVGYALLPETLRIRWHYGTYEHWGPEVIATAPALVVFPIVIGSIVLISRPLVHRFRQHSSESALVFEAVVLMSLGVIVGTQVLVIGLNLLLP